MTQYRRDRTAGASWFFTVNLADRRATLLIDHIDLLRTVFRRVRQSHWFNIDAIVVLPDHLHTIWTLPADDADYSLRWRLIKTAFSRALPSGERISASRQAKGERGIWQRRFWEHRIRDDDDFARHVDYIHINPLKHGHVNKLADWPWSSFQHYVAAGMLGENWGGDTVGDGLFGER